jgi:hypothetical protein
LQLTASDWDGLDGGKGALPSTATDCAYAPLLYLLVAMKLGRESGPLHLLSMCCYHLNDQASTVLTNKQTNKKT